MPGGNNFNDFPESQLTKFGMVEVSTIQAA